MTPGTAPAEISLSELVRPHARQREFLAALAGHDYVLYGGAAGGGKSYILRWALIGLLLYYAGEGLRGVRVGLFSLDYPTLHDRQLSKVRAEVPDWLGDFNESKRELTLFPEFGSGVLCFRNLDDPSKYKSAEFAAIAVDELTEHEETVFDDLRFRLRWQGVPRPKFLGATNPEGVGLHWVKRLWVDRDFPDNLKPKADQFAYIPAKATDNPHLDPSYVETLRSLPPDRRAALLDGSWDVFKGQVFGEFRRDVHVCQPFPIPDWWSVWGGNDPGFNEPGAWYALAADGDGTAYVVKEWTFEHRAAPYSQQAKAVALSLGTLRPSYWVTGMDAYNKHPETGKTIIDYYRDGGIAAFRQPVHGPGSRAAMAGVFHELLRVFPGNEGKPTAKLKIFATCTRLISTLPVLPADELKPEQVAECAIDHWYQACGYALQSRFSAGGNKASVSRRDA